MREWVRGDPVASDGLRYMPPGGACADRQRAKPDIVAISRRADHARFIIRGQLASDGSRLPDMPPISGQATNTTKVIQTSVSLEWPDFPRLA
ncbi:hypothetical protein [Cobetia amphilecti]|uniref:hypothetical protein n=1 Tax=Cobetia amphilecti TaxID=1055104 RepID=UPI00336DEED8